LRKYVLPLSAPLLLAGCDGGGLGTPFMVLIEAISHALYLTILGFLILLGAVFLILFMVILWNWKQNPEDRKQHPTDRPPS